METMMSRIEWTAVTWNPIVGCSIESEGCNNCYAMRMAARLAAMGQEPYQDTTRKVKNKDFWTGDINRSSDRVFTKPHDLPRGEIIFVNSISDLFHPDADPALVMKIIEIMLSEPRHIFQVLTKRPYYAASFLKQHGIILPVHVWVGTSVENAKVKHRIDGLRSVAATVRFLSLEPLINSLGNLDLANIEWVITGGESGPGARFCDPEWIREVRDQCVGAAVPFFHKQNGSNPQNFAALPGGKPKGNPKGGNLLDGKKWLQYPTTGHSLDRPSTPPLRPSATVASQLQTA
jgi:protein gp37